MFSPLDLHKNPVHTHKKKKLSNIIINRFHVYCHIVILAWQNEENGWDKIMSNCKYFSLDIYSFGTFFGFCVGSWTPILLVDVGVVPFRPNEGSAEYVSVWHRQQRPDKEYPVSLISPLTVFLL